jgi:hypothetical protein
VAQPCFASKVGLTEFFQEVLYSALVVVSQSVAVENSVVPVVELMVVFVAEFVMEDELEDEVARVSEVDLCVVEQAVFGVVFEFERVFVPVAEVVCESVSLRGDRLVVSTKPHLRQPWVACGP